MVSREVPLNSSSKLKPVTGATENVALIVWAAVTPVKIYVPPVAATVVTAALSTRTELT